jgi:acyl-CoA reductase-like NAD-dependent aldehyde dehydrogenase
MDSVRACESASTPYTACAHDDSTLGPLIHERAVAKCVEHVDDAVKKGAKVVTKHRDVDGDCFFPPTVLANAPKDCVSLLVCERYQLTYPVDR